MTQLNINAGYNEAIKETCQTLKEYMQYVERVRFYAGQMEMNLAKAVERAVDECIKAGILEEFLIRNRAEAISVSIFEYDEVKEKELIRKAEYQVGKNDGMKEGRLEGRQEGRQEGRREQLKDQVRIKLEKGRDCEQIADALEADIPVIEQLIREIQKEKADN